MTGALEGLSDLEFLRALTLLATCDLSYDKASSPF